MNVVDIDKLIDAINKISERDLWDYIIFIIPIIVSIIATLVNIWLVNKNTNKQIKNQNKETYRPRLKLKQIKIVEHDIDRMYLYAHSKEYVNEKTSISLYADIELENIGNGIANDITFYMLHSGHKCLSVQTENKYSTQTLNSTIEIPKDKSQIIKFLFNFNKEAVKSDEIEEIDGNDVILLICNYKDLNNNSYRILIGFILKTYEPFKLEMTENDEVYNCYNDGKYDMYYYQEETASYKGMINKERYKKHYKKILKDINK